jgi:Polyketide cyclase / dehydrase and lipid transport
VDIVWRLTVDLEGWPAITPTVTRLARLDDGPLGVGSRARLKQPRQPEAVWTVTHLEPGRRFTWQTTRLGLTMIGSHLLDAAGGGCRNTLTLDVQGAGAALFGRLAGRRIGDAIAAENAGFRARAEQLRAAGNA